MLGEIQSKLQQLGVNQNHQKYNMLGIESEISVQAEVSRLSISSNPNRDKREKIVSANNSSTLHSEGGVSGNLANNLKNEKIKQLRNKMHQISRNQEAIQSRMKSYVVMVERELKKKEEQNRQLEGLISSLKDELAESRADLEILTNYVVKKMPAPSKEQPKLIRISNASSQQSDNHSSQNQSKKMQGFHPNQQKQGKSISPKHKLTILEKSKNFSPVSKEQIKVSYSGPLTSGAQRKFKSPGK